MALDAGRVWNLHSNYTLGFRETWDPLKFAAWLIWQELVSSGFPKIYLFYTNPRRTTHKRQTSFWLVKVCQSSVRRPSFTDPNNSIIAWMFCDCLHCSTVPAVKNEDFINKICILLEAIQLLFNYCEFQQKFHFSLQWVVNFLILY